ncbi:hypothetical protein KAX75_00585, partial [candidate division WOR-3 bacterium]|nr:hypothetical protein [candidate division WOR-3 bacterium]
LLPLSLENGLLTIQIENPNGFIKDELEQKGGKKLIEDIISRTKGEKIKVKFVETKTKNEEKKKPVKTKKGSLKDNEMVKKVQEILNAKIVNER